MEFNQVEKESKAKQMAVKANLKDDQYIAGWNSALEMAAYRIEHDFLKSFGKDTLSSIAIYLRELKK